MRFLPCHPSEFAPFVENRTHMFQLQNGSWFGCDCLSKWGKPCPICDYNRMMWKKWGREEGRNKVLGKFKPKYVSNVLIVRNPNAPETEGKVFRYGEQLGANFVFEGVQVGKFTKNDSSHFGSQKPINKWNGKSFVELTDAEIDEIEKNLYTLADCEHKENEVKDYQQILDAYLAKNGAPLFEGTAANTPAPATSVTSGNDEDDEPSFTPNVSASTDEESVDSDDFFARLKSN